MSATSAIISTLTAHNVVGATIVGEHRGSAVIRYDVQLMPGTRVDAVRRLTDELAMATASHAVRVAPVPGTSLVGIEVPVAREDRPAVPLVLADDALPSLSVHVGNGTDGEPVHVDLAKAPHLLIAGQTGSGKSVAMTSIIAQLMERNRPDEVRFLMADPKRVELSAFGKAPHLQGEVAYEVAEMLGMLNYAVEEMEARYEAMRELGVNHVMSVAGRPFAYLVIVLDEISDLMIQSKGAAEAPMVRIAQLGRAAGIHLVAATQYPKAEVVTSLLSANIPSRLVFSVASHTQSKVALGETGAEKLLGQGDGLLSFAGDAVVHRILSPFVTPEQAREAAELWAEPATAFGTPDSTPEPDPALEPTTSTIHQLGVTAPVREDVMEVAGPVATVPEPAVQPAEHLYAPDGTPMQLGDRICYICNRRRAFPGALVCLSPECTDPVYTVPTAPIPMVAAELAHTSAWGRWRHGRRAARNLRKAGR